MAQLATYKHPILVTTGMEWNDNIVVSLAKMKLYFPFYPANQVGITYSIVLLYYEYNLCIPVKLSWSFAT